MASCKNPLCEFDRFTKEGKRTIACLVGRVRMPLGTVIENCPDHKEKKEEACRWCEEWEWFISYRDITRFFDRTASYLITLDRPMTECPVCGEKLM